ncbi:uncharacterized protein LOC119375954 [Rhipicephalus sanguineus]|uniref:uncharacterized protein LOC119375954 n=1 Tax=Rhipicephalus sanguineus TaxID=34632 RepID=UPI001892F8EF|nr:uncharacterized protein LOC119375954 [Rhipicephalus sanguineus]
METMVEYRREKESSRGTAAPRARPPPPASGPSSPETHHHPYARKHQDPGPHLLSRSPLLPSLVPPASVRRLPRLSRPAYEGAEELHAPSSEQEVPEDEHAPSDNAATPPGLDDVNFPPLAAATTAPPNLDEAPIVSRGYYPLPDSEHPPPGPLPPAVTQTPGPTSGDPTPAATPMAQSGLVRRDRSRSRSPLRGDTMAATAESSHPPSLDNKHRRPKTHDLSSDSDAPPTAKSQKLGTPPSGKGHPPPGAGGKR